MGHSRLWDGAVGDGAIFPGAFRGQAPIAIPIILLLVFLESLKGESSLGYEE